MRNELTKNHSLLHLTTGGEPAIKEVYAVPSKDDSLSLSLCMQKVNPARRVYKLRRHDKNKRIEIKHICVSMWLLKGNRFRDLHGLILSSSIP